MATPIHPGDSVTSPAWFNDNTSWTSHLPALVDPPQSLSQPEAIQGWSNDQPKWVDDHWTWSGADGVKSSDPSRQPWTPEDFPHWLQQQSPGARNRGPRNITQSSHPKRAILAEDRPLVHPNDYASDGEHVGAYQTKDKSLFNYVVWQKNEIYSRLTFTGDVVVVCQLIRTFDGFPCIVDNLRALFGLVQRGTQRIKLDSYEYIMYYVPVVDSIIVRDTPLSAIKNIAELRDNDDFRVAVQRNLLFRDIVGFGTNGISCLAVRQMGQKMSVLSTKETCTPTTKKDLYSSQYVCSNMSNAIIKMWFEEHVDHGDIIRTMLGGDSRATINMEILQEQIHNIVCSIDPGWVHLSSIIFDRIKRKL